MQNSSMVLEDNKYHPCVYVCGGRKKGQETIRGHGGFWDSGDVLFLDLSAGSTVVFTCEGLSSSTIMIQVLSDMYFILQ